MRARLFPLAVAPLVLAACATVPTGPSAMVLPGTGKSFEQFRYDDLVCRQFAFEQSGARRPDDAGIDSGVRSAAVGTVVGAAAGAAIGGSRGAGVGAGTGLIVGSAAGTGSAQVSSYEAQRRYDIGYEQCMYAKGHRVPVSGRFMSSPASPPAPPALRTQPPPPPPPGAPPPPPPR